VMKGGEVIRNDAGMAGSSSAMAGN
jgi:hypothetical protein